MFRDSDESVHGCSPDASQDGQNICYKPVSGSKTLVHVGNDDEIDEFSLEECQGDCDTDADCVYGLVCLERTGNGAVPGCTGAGITMEDYCIQPPKDNQLILFGINGSPSINYPLQACQGDCGTDDDCAVSCSTNRICTYVESMEFLTIILLPKAGS